MKTNQEKLEEYLGKMNKIGIQEYREKFREQANKAIDNAEEVLIIVSEKSVETLGTPPHVITGLLSAVETIADADDNNTWIIKNIKLLLERLEENNE